MLDKKALRRQIGQLKRAMTDKQIEGYSRQLSMQLFETELYRNAKAIYVYLPYNQEVRTWDIIRKAWADGKRVAVPKVYGDEMEFLWLDDFSQIAPGGWDIPEPTFDTPIADDETALILMPGLAFDPQGHRVGYGGGFYDKYLEKHPGHPLVALCYPFQMFDHLEVEEHDVPVDLVITNERFKRFEQIDWVDSFIEEFHIEGCALDMVIFNDAYQQHCRATFTGFAGLTNLCIWDDVIIHGILIQPADDSDPYMQNLYKAYGCQHENGEGRDLAEGMMEIRITLANDIAFSIYCQDNQVEIGIEYDTPN